MSTSNKIMSKAQVQVVIIPAMTSDRNIFGRCNNITIIRYCTHCLLQRRGTSVKSVFERIWSENIKCNLMLLLHNITRSSSVSQWMLVLHTLCLHLDIAQTYSPVACHIDRRWCIPCNTSETQKQMVKIHAHCWHCLPVSQLNVVDVMETKLWIDLPSCTNKSTHFPYATRMNQTSPWNDTCLTQAFAIDLNWKIYWIIINIQKFACFVTLTVWNFANFPDYWLLTFKNHACCIFVKIW